MTKCTMSQAALAYDRWISLTVQHAVADGATAVPAVMAYLPGVFPLVIADKLRRMGFPTPEPVDVLQPAPIADGITDFLLPHPLDFDWRFGTVALQILSHAVQEARKEQPLVYCFGCPSVAKFIQGQSWHAEVRLFDSNGSLHEEGTPAWKAESNQQILLTPGVVVADPPWYPRHCRRFLWVIQQSCGVGTDVFLAGPPIGTRPGVKAEMLRLFGWARKLGFKVVSHRSSALPYVMPLFEMNTLKAYGVHDVPLDWRKADLWHLKLLVKMPARPPIRRLTDGLWEERRFDAVRIRARVDGPLSGSTALRPLGRYGFLGSVSSRDPMRRQATVVTSGGRFFSCENPIRLIRSEVRFDPAQECRQSLTPNDTSHTKWDLPRLIAVERSEAASYYDLIHKIAGL